jgi:hypothetical protein
MVGRCARSSPIRSSVFRRRGGVQRSVAQTRRDRRGRRYSTRSGGSAFADAVTGSHRVPFGGLTRRDSDRISHTRRLAGSEASRL